MVQTIIPSGFFCLRTHLLPCDTIHRWNQGPDTDRALLRSRLRSLIETAVVREAIFIASPALDEAIAVWLAEPDSDRGRRAERSLVKYLVRLAGRPTPFGLFAAVATGRLGRDTSLEVPGPGACRRHTRLDNAWLFALAHALNADPAVRAAARYRPNDSLVFAAGHGRYTEARPAKVGHSFHLVAVEETPAIRDTLARAAVPGGATRAELAAALLNDEIAQAEAEAFVDELIESQLLVSDLGVAVTGPEPAAVLADRLAAIPACRPIADLLHLTLATLDQMDHDPLGHAPARYRELAAGLAELPTPVELPRLFQVDLVRPTAGTLGENVLQEIRRGVELLHRIGAAPAETPLDRFVRAFEDRYHGRAVPLLEALDEETGLGAVLWPAADPSPLLTDLPLAPAEPERQEWSARTRHLLHQAGLAAFEGREEWRLEPSDLDALRDPAPLPLADDIAAFATLAAADSAAVARGDFLLHLDSVQPGAARLLGRFCHADAELHRGVMEQLRVEASRDPEALYAELVHLPEGRLGNILLRPVLRGWEITYLGQSGAAPEHQIPASDLDLTLRDGRLELWSRRQGRRVVPRLSTAHNTETGLTPYRFLTLLEHQGRAPARLWDWGPAAVLPFLPRLAYGRLILALARWRLSRAEIGALLHGGEAERVAALEDFRVRRRLPRWISLVEADLRLPLDLENPLSVDCLLHELTGQDDAILEELWPGPDRLVARGPEGTYRHELVVPLLVESPGPGTVPPPTVRRPVSAAERGPGAFPPGSRWLYLKLYAGLAEADAILEEVVGPLSRRWAAKGVVDNWFFIRYSDPESHLRWRLQGEPAALRRKVWPAIEKALVARLAAGAVWRVQLDTYEREVERYGGPGGIGHAERIFQADSEAVVELLGMFDRGDAGLDERWRLGLAGVDRLFADFGLSLTERIRQLGASAGYGSVSAPEAALRHRLTQRFREHRAAIEALLDTAGMAAGPLAPGLEVLRERSARLEAPVAALTELARRGALPVPLGELAGSVIHMSLNRLLRGAPNAHETVLYDFLRRVYEGWVGRGR